MARVLVSKRCSKCGKCKSLLAFHKDRSKPDGYYPSCKVCHNAQGKEWANTPKGIESHQAAKAKYKRTQKGQLASFKYAVKKQYGLSWEQYLAMYERYGGKCHICLRPEARLRNGRPLWLAVDHDHSTGVIRGLLCASCNAMLGLANDDPKLLRRAASYLRG